MIKMIFSVLFMVIGLQKTISESPINPYKSSPCAAPAQKESSNGQTIWEVKIREFNFFSNECIWDLNPPDPHHLIFVHIFDLDLQNDQNQCLAHLVVNGNSMCITPAKPCMIFRLGQGDVCQQKSRTVSNNRCSVKDWTTSAYAIKLRPNKFYYKRISDDFSVKLHFIYSYINCSSNGLDISGKKSIAFTHPMKKKKIISTTPQAIKMSKNTIVYSTTIPAAILLFVLIIVLIVKRRNNSNFNQVRDIGTTPSLDDKSSQNETQCTKTKFSLDVSKDHIQLHDTAGTSSLDVSLHHGIIETHPPDDAHHYETIGHKYEDIGSKIMKDNVMYNSKFSKQEMVDNIIYQTESQSLN